MNLKQTFYKTFQRCAIAVIAVLIGTLSLFAVPGLTSDALAEFAGMPVGGLIFTFDEISDLEYSTLWYQEVLGMERSPLETPKWTLLFYPEQPSVQIELFADTLTGTGSDDVSFIVPDLEYAVDVLESRGVAASPICDAGAGVAISVFQDPDGNALSFASIVPDNNYPKCFE
ncbi:MAG: VOC family protein [Cyanobacteria bacterium P01_E01_bin.42]